MVARPVSRMRPEDIPIEELVAAAEESLFFDESAVFERWARDTLEDIRRRVRGPGADAYHTFVEAVFRDENDDPVEQAEIHRAWESHSRWCYQHRLIPTVLAPWGHGKSVQRVCLRVAFMLARNPSLRILVVTNTDANAKNRTRLVSSILASDGFKMLFPEVEFSRPPTDYEIHMKRRGRAGDPSFTARTIFSKGVGARVDVIIVDDVSDLENSLLKPAERSKVGMSVKGATKSRLVPRKKEKPGRRPPREWTGYTEQIGTRWHDEDWWGECLRSGAYCTLVLAMAQDNGRINCAVVGPADALESYPWAYQIIQRTFDPDEAPGPAPDDLPVLQRYESAKAIGTIPLWEEGGYDQEEMGRREVDDPRWHNCGRRQIPYSEGEQAFPHFGQCVHKVEPRITVPSGWYVTVGCDPGGTTRPGNAIAVIAGNESERVFLEIRLGKWTGTELSEQLTEVFQRWNPDAVVVETNALQAYLVEIGMLAKAPWTSRVRPFHTGSNKMNPLEGVPALDIEFSHNAWSFPGLAWSGHPQGHEEQGCPWCVLRRAFVTTTRQDLRHHTDRVDTIMATWFAHRRLIQLCRYVGAVGFVGSDGSVEIDRYGNVTEEDVKRIRRQIEADDELTPKQVADRLASAVSGAPNSEWSQVVIDSLSEEIDDMILDNSGGALLDDEDDW